MRIVSYNILDGGEGRADPLAEVIEAQRPDIVALAEATDLTVIERIARRLKMDYVQGPGKKQASALLSRFTIGESINHALLRDGLSKSFLEATLVLADGSELIAAVVHLHDGATDAAERQRLGEIQIILDTLDRHRRAGVPQLIAGDFNANAPTQRIDPQQCKARTREEWEQNGGRIPREVIARVLDAGYVDSLHAIAPEIVDTTGTFTTQHPGQRVDYIFTHGLGVDRIDSAWIEQDRLAKYASDHFPVGLEVV